MRNLEPQVAKKTQRRTARLAYSIPRPVWESDVSRSMIYEEIAAGRLIARKIGRRTIVRRADALAWLRSLPRLLPGDHDRVADSRDSGPTKSRPGAATATEDHISGQGASAQ